MNAMQDDGGTAFPVLERGRYGLELTSLGMSLRDYFAAKALQGILANPNAPRGIFASVSAYHAADAMLKGREACGRPPG